MKKFNKVNNEVGETEWIQDSINASTENTSKNLAEGLQPSKKTEDEYTRKTGELKKRATELYLSNKVLQRV